MFTILGLKYKKLGITLPNALQKGDFMSIGIGNSYASSSAYSVGQTSSTQKSGFDQMIASMSQDLFSSLDSDKSSGVDATEFSDAAKALASKLGTTNSDDKTTKAFGSLDSNQDGTITQDELTSGVSAMFQAAMQQATGSMPPPPPEGGKGHHGKHKEDKGLTQEELTSISSDMATKDPQRASFMAKIAENFDAADSDKNGRVTRDEAMAYGEENNLLGGSSSQQQSSTTSNSADTKTSFEQLMLSKLIASYTQNSSSGTSSLLSSVSA